jgi:surface antigen
MYYQTGRFYRFRFVVAGMSALAAIVLFSSLVTVLGSGTALASPIPNADSGINTDIADSPNVVTAMAYNLGSGVEHLSLKTGATLYTGCHHITMASAHAGRLSLNSTAAIAHTAGSSVMFTLHIPGKIVGSLTQTHSVSSIIRPAENKPVPVISAETSAAALATLNAAQQQAFARLQADQVIANRNLGGVILAGDPNHGGYPAKWDNVAQDSRLDSWGMYNRECVSYAAWKVYQTYGNMPYWGGVGNANQWVRDARSAGIPTGKSPVVHSVAISMQGYYGHAMWVEKVSGSMIYVSQYNYDLRGHYSEMWVNGSAFTYIYFK